MDHDEDKTPLLTSHSENDLILSSDGEPEIQFPESFPDSLRRRITSYNSRPLSGVSIEPSLTSTTLAYGDGDFDFYDEIQRRNSSDDKFPELVRKSSSSFNLDPDFDITPVHLLKLFNNLDHDHSGRISYDKMKEGLDSISKTFTDNVKLDMLTNLLEEVDVDKSHDITQAEFVSTVQEYTARAFAEEGGHCECFCFDYGPDVSYCQWVDTKIHQRHRSNSLAQTFSSASANYLTMSEFQKIPTNLPSDVKVRWVAINGDDMSVFIRVCNKYKIHPLQMEDVLERKERPKVESFGETNMHIVIGQVSLKVNDKYMKVKVHQMNIFMLDNNTIICFMKDKSKSDVYQTLMSRIMYSGSKLRLGDSRFLVYSIVDGVVDRVYPIMKLFNTQLKSLQQKIQAESNTQLEVINQIQQIYRELNVLLFWLRPINNVVLRLLEDLPKKEDRELKHHLQDLKDHVVMLQEQAANLVTWSKSLNDDYRNEQANRMSQVMYVLTLVTTIFIPAQFLTGVFGMNFEYMPELKYKWSYLLFWVAVFVFSVFSYLIFKWKGWLQM